MQSTFVKTFATTAFCPNDEACLKYLKYNLKETFKDFFKQ